MKILMVMLLFLAACAEVPPTLPDIQAPQLVDDAMITSDGARLPIRRWLPDGEPKAVIAALHGFNDYSAAFDLPGPRLAAAGIAVYAYDQRGFGQAPDIGRWPGEPQLHQDLYQFLRLLAARYPGRPLFVLGESMGGAVALTALSHPAIDQADIPPLAGLILVAPAVWSRSEMPWYQGASLWLGARLIPWVTLTGRGLHIQASDNIEMLRKMSRDPLVIKATRIATIAGLCDLMDDASLAPSRVDLPGLILIGRKDEVVPANASAAMLGLTPPNLRPLFYDDGYHMLLRDLHAERPVDDIIAWVLRQ